MTGFLDRSAITQSPPKEGDLRSNRVVPEIVKNELNASIDQIELEWYGKTSEELPSEKLLQQEAQYFADSLRKIYTYKDTAKLCGASVAEVKSWVEGKALPNEWQWRFLRYAREVTTILRIKLGTDGMRHWMNSRNEYLAGYRPIDLIISDPVGVRSAAMMTLTYGPPMA